MKYIAESVTRFHPDKICDQISDAILDTCLAQDPNSRVAVETMGGHGIITLTGEITTKASVDYKQIAKHIYGKDIYVRENISTQSPEISQGVNTGGAGDQGIMVGYACNENEQHIPQELYVARKLLKPFDVDGKSQITIENGAITSIVLSVQGKTQKELKEYLNVFGDIPIYCNNTGSFDIGGFDADAGVTGRKIVVDAYGPRVPVGGGAFSGKDPSKVDRSAAYMARFMALEIMKRLGAHEVLVKLGYVIGKIEPVLVDVLINGKIDTVNVNYDCRPQAIIERFNLKRPIYLETAQNGHFGFKHYPWEQV